MKLENSIRKKIEETFKPTFLEIENESAKHHRPAGAETHFRVIIVSTAFEGVTRVDRQRQVANLFDEERDLGLHAFSQKTFTPTEWETSKDKLTLESPQCGHQMQPSKKA
jgi:stress-induced morphogen